MSRNSNYSASLHHWDPVHLERSGTQASTLIANLGTVTSPRFAWQKQSAKRRGMGLQTSFLGQNVHHCCAHNCSTSKDWENRDVSLYFLKLPWALHSSSEKSLQPCRNQQLMKWFVFAGAERRGGQILLKSRQQS